MKAKVLKIKDGHNYRGIHGKLVLVKCHQCKKEWWISYSRIKNGAGKHCSHKCYTFYLGRENLSSLRQKIYNSSHWKNWRSAIFSRDNFTCQRCKTIGGYLEAHHNNKSFSQLLKENRIKTLEDALICDALWDIKNGKTLCKKCHNKNKQGRNG